MKQTLRHINHGLKTDNWILQDRILCCVVSQWLNGRARRLDVALQIRFDPNKVKDEQKSQIKKIIKNKNYNISIRKEEKE